jgi:hypothetical protein
MNTRTKTIRTKTVIHLLSDFKEDISGTFPGLKWILKLITKVISKIKTRDRVNNGIKIIKDTALPAKKAQKTRNNKGE